MNYVDEPQEISPNSPVFKDYDHNKSMKFQYN